MDYHQQQPDESTCAIALNTASAYGLRQFNCWEPKPRKKVHNKWEVLRFRRQSVLQWKELGTT
jgi:hypothetical protein